VLYFIAVETATRFAGERADEETTTQPMRRWMRYGEGKACFFERVAPSKHMLIHAVHERAIEIKQPVYWKRVADVTSMQIFPLLPPKVQIHVRLGMSFGSSVLSWFAVRRFGYFEIQIGNPHRGSANRFDFHYLGQGCPFAYSQCPPGRASSSSGVNRRRQL
jgi:hypothetical protein